MSISRTLRYLAPNLITGTSIIFGLLSLVATYERRFAVAGWFIIYAVMTDRLDGLVARLVRGTSELGVQLDSLADFLTFGLAPPFLMFACLDGAPSLPFSDGAGRVFLMVAAACWVLAASFRLARYNITPDQTPAGRPRIFFGVPTTLAGGTLVIWFLALLKYAPAGAPVRPAEPFGGQRLLGDLATPDGVWVYFPVAMLVGAFLMASSLRMPKLGLARSKLATAFVFANVGVGYVCAFARVFPEYLVLAPTAWLVVFLVWGQVSPTARGMRPPPFLPPSDPAPGAEPQRPEDDMLDDHEIGDDDLQF
jgi:CDP-diacylglycerol--serine O-phosphatidyltransferase